MRLVVFHILIPMHSSKIILLIAFTAGLGLAGCSSPAGPDPKVSSAKEGTAKTSAAVADNHDMPFPKLEKGMTEATIRKLIGEPKEIQPTPSPEGKAEVWIYHFEKDLGMVQVASGTRTVQVMSMGSSSSGTRDVQEPIYTMAAKKADITLSILMFNGQLEVQKAKVEETIEHHAS